jgi:hypothetical protein
VCSQRAIAAAVLVEGVARVVRLGPVELEREPLPRPVDVELVAGHGHVELRLGKAALLA